MKAALVIVFLLSAAVLGSVRIERVRCNFNSGINLLECKHKNYKKSAILTFIRHRPLKFTKIVQLLKVYTNADQNDLKLTKCIVDASLNQCNNAEPLDFGSKVLMEAMKTAGAKFECPVFPGNDSRNIVFDDKLVPFVSMNLRFRVNLTEMNDVGDGKGLQYGFMMEIFGTVRK